MVSPRVPLLILSGPVGVGKTTLGQEINTILNEHGVAHSFVDLDMLAETYPRPARDRFNKKLALRNLRDVWKNCAAVGSRNIVIPRVVEVQNDVDDICRAVPGSSPVICQLRASDETLKQRVRKRETGSGLAWHEARSLELARLLRDTAPRDFDIDTENRPPIDIAKEVVSLVEWR